MTKKINKYTGKTRVCCGCQKKKNIVHFNMLADGSRDSQCKKCTGISDIDWQEELKRQPKKRTLKKSTLEHKAWRINNETKAEKEAKERKRIERELIIARLKANLPLEELSFA